MKLCDLPLLKRRLGKRKNRFVAQIWDEEKNVWEEVYCPSTGSLKTCWVEGETCWISQVKSTTRKLPHTLEVVSVDQVNIWIHTHKSNDLFEQALRLLQAGKTFKGSHLMKKDFSSLFSIKREARYGQNSRLDFLLTNKQGSSWVELKTVTMEENQRACFPDAVTLRGQKHLKDLKELASHNEKAFLVFLISRSSSLGFEPASHIDPEYSVFLKEACEAGVQIRLFYVSWENHQVKLQSYEKWNFCEKIKV
jgi:sugar fermentation stimulation protein A